MQSVNRGLFSFNSATCGPRSILLSTYEGHCLAAQPLADIHMKIILISTLYIIGASHVVCGVKQIIRI
jgi:hypothetical protein